MNWISNVVRRKSARSNRRETPENLWVKYPETGEIVFHRDLEANQFVIPGSELPHAHRRHDAAEDDLRRRQLDDIAVPEVPSIR